MQNGVDPGLLRQGAHSASYFALSRSMGDDKKIIDFCIPCNPYYPTPQMFSQIHEKLETILKYYPSDSSSTTNKLATHLGLHPQTVAMANGSTELITWIDHLLVKESIAIPIPTFGRWTDQPMETGKRVDMYLLQEHEGYRLDLSEYIRFIRNRGSRVAVVCNPNNPDGGFLPRRDLLQFVDALADLDLVVIDESFLDFVDAERQPSLAVDAAIRPNVIVLKSLGKNFGLHGIRFGYLVANPALAGKVGKMLPKWNINSLAEHVVYMVKDHEAEYQESLRMLSRDRRWMFDALQRVPGLTIFPSQGNFFLVKLPPNWGGVELKEFLINNHSIYIRECGNKLGMTSQFLRLVVRPPDDVDRLIEGLLGYARQKGDDRLLTDPLAEVESRLRLDEPAERRYSTDPEPRHSHGERSYPERSYPERSYPERSYPERSYPDRDHLGRDYSDREDRKDNLIPYPSRRANGSRRGSRASSF